MNLLALYLRLYASVFYCATRKCGPFPP